MSKRLLSSDTPEEGIRSHYRWLWTTTWLLGFELRTFRRAVSALNRWVISPALKPPHYKHTYANTHTSAYTHSTHMHPHMHTYAHIYMCICTCTHTTCTNTNTYMICISFQVIQVMINLHCQLDSIWNHLGDTPLDVFVKCFQKGLTVEGSPTLNMIALSHRLGPGLN